MNKIAETMIKLHVPTGGEKLKWRAQTVRSILANEKYCGDVLVSKSFVEDIFTHKKIKNTGKRKMIYEQDHHEAIISRKDFTRALLLLKANYKSPYFNLHYEAKIIKNGLLTGFIPLNIAFGGYNASNYLAAFIYAEIPVIDFGNETIKISRSVPAEMFDCDEALCLTFTKTTIEFNSSCVKYFGNCSVEILLHPQERLLAIRKTDSQNPNGIKLKMKRFLLK